MFYGLRRLFGKAAKRWPFGSWSLILIPQFPGSFFQIKFLNETCVIVPRDVLKEIFDAPEDTLSFHGSSREQLQLKHTMGRSLVDNNYHVAVIKAELTRHISVKMPDIVDELNAAFKDELSVGHGTLI